jgi:hypothetical protein
VAREKGTSAKKPAARAASRSAASKPAASKTAAAKKAPATKAPAKKATAKAPARTAAKTSARGSAAKTAARGRAKAPAVWTQTSERGGWEVLVQGNARPSSRHATKAEAVAAGRARAMKLKAEHVIKTKDGKIAARNSYGGDPRRSKG